MFTGALAYADDLILLSPTKSAMQKLVDVCENFSKEFHINFNPSKSKMIVYSNNQQPDIQPFSMQGQAIETVRNEKHLGNIIGKNALDKQILSCVAELNGNVNLLMSQFSGVHLDTMYSLYKSFCMSVYGSQLWDLSHNLCNVYYTAWRKCIRRLLSLSPRTHSSLLHLICLDCPIDVQLHLRFIKFFQNCLQSDNIYIKICTKLVIHGSRSDVCNSLTFICNKYNLNRYELQCNIAQIRCNQTCSGSDIDLQKAALIRDLKDYNFCHFDQNVNDIIFDLCTH